MPLILIAADARIAAQNQAAERLFGAMAVGRHHIIVLRQPALLDAIEQVQRTREVAEAAYVTSEAKREITFRAIAAPVDPAVGGDVIVSFEDTTALQDTMQMRRDFVANVSHELKTPLTAVLGFIETLRGAARRDPEAQDRFLQIMEREAMRMNRLVGDLLSLNRVESDERMRPRERVEIDALMRSVALSLQPMAADKGTEIVIVCGADPVTVPGDPDQLRQVLNNLVENAIKYAGEAGPITLSLTSIVYEAMVLGPAIRLDVIDRGEGVAAEHIPRLTERFYRVDAHRSRNMGGTGLGLAIVKHIVNRHRGRLRIESAVGAGTTFSVILPAR